MNPVRFLIALLAIGIIGSAYFLLRSEPDPARASLDVAAARTPGGEAAPREVAAVEVAGAGAPAATGEDGGVTRAVAEAATPPSEPSGKASARVAVRGRVVDDGGSPLAGVPVAIGTSGGFLIIDATRGDRQPPRNPATKSGADGRFEIEDVRPGFGTSVRAEPDRHVIAEKPLPEAKGVESIDVGDLVCALGGAIEGRIVDENGAPVAGAEVEAWPVDPGRAPSPGMVVFGDAGRSLLRRSTTDGGGSYRIEGLAPGEVALAAAKSGHARDFKKGVLVTRSATTRDVDLVLSSGLSIVGTVVDDLGRPVAGAKVRYFETVIDLSHGGLSSQFAKSSSVTADAAGGFRIHGLEESSYNLTANAAGHFDVTSNNVAAGADDVRIVTPRAGIAYGYVRDAKTGSPIADFGIDLDRKNFIGPLGADVMDHPILRGAAAGEALGIDDSLGLYAVIAPPAERIGLTIRAEGYAPTTLSDVVVPVADRALRDVSLTREIVITGFVTSPDLEPLEGASVTLTKFEEAQPGLSVRRLRRATTASVDDEGVTATFDDDARRIAHTDENGAFTLRGLAPGDFQLVASHPLHAPSDAMRIALEADADPDPGELVLRAGGLLAGRAFDAAGVPLAGGDVRLAKKRSPSATGEMFTPPLPPELSGEKPLAGKTDADGYYEIPGIPPGEYMASLVKPDGGPRGGPMILMAIGNDPQKGKPVEIVAGQRSELDLALEPTGGVRGRVTESGAPLANQSVGIRNKNSPMPMDIATARTDSNGAYVLEDIEPGEYVVAVKPPGASQAITRPVNVRARAQADVDIALPTGGVAGTVKDKDSQDPLEGVSVSVRKHRKEGSDEPVERRAMAIVMVGGAGGGMSTMRIGDDEDSVRTDAEGNYEIRYLEPGDYDVEIRGGVSPNKRTSIRVEEG
jgi:protocatechuate 3,4-dioxygenase beta subunit